MLDRETRTQLKQFEREIDEAIKQLEQWMKTKDDKFCHKHGQELLIKLQNKAVALKKQYPDLPELPLLKTFADSIPKRN